MRRWSLAYHHLQTRASILAAHVKWSWYDIKVWRPTWPGTATSIATGPLSIPCIGYKSIKETNISCRHIIEAYRVLLKTCSEDTFGRMLILAWFRTTLWALKMGDKKDSSSKVRTCDLTVNSRTLYQLSYRGFHDTVHTPINHFTCITTKAYVWQFHEVRTLRCHVQSNIKQD